jgi:hypothetical protein
LPATSGGKNDIGQLVEVFPQVDSQTFCAYDPEGTAEGYEPDGLTRKLNPLPK